MDRQLNRNETTMAPAGPQGGKLLDRFRLLPEEKGWAPVMAEQETKGVRTLC